MPEEQKQDPNIINARPTKDFFISMLVKDINLNRVIIDLVDNSLDGARRIRRVKEGFTGLLVRIEATKDHFRISDNCGGIPVEVAREYAFRFGRPSGAPSTRHSVGQFGVGMKRAIFKLGTKFRIESKTNNSSFVVEEDVDKWKKTDIWEFNFKLLEEHTKVEDDQVGTIITVTSLHPAIAEEFELDTFQKRLATEIAEAQAESMQKGLAISLGKLPVQYRALEFLQSGRLKPVYQVMSWGHKASKVDVKIYAGVSESNPNEAGWYVFCNGRMILGANQSKTTGWGEGNGKTIPKYHNQFAMFRGYVFFDSDDAGALPWNTTKTGVDEDSPHYKAVRLKMITMMRPVVDFLNKLDAEKGREASDPKPLERAVIEAKRVNLDRVDLNPLFVTPKPAPVEAPPWTGKIQYSKPVEEIEKVKKALKVRTLKAVGEKTFEYFFNMECKS